VINLQEVVQFEPGDVGKDGVASNVLLFQHHLDFTWPVDVLHDLVEALVHLLRDEFDSEAQTSESFFDLGEDVGSEDHDHEGVSVLEYEAVQVESLPVLVLKNFNEAVRVSEQETWLKHLQKRQLDLGESA